MHFQKRRFSLFKTYAVGNFELLKIELLFYTVILFELYYFFRKSFRYGHEQQFVKEMLYACFILR